MIDADAFKKYITDGWRYNKDQFRPVFGQKEAKEITDGFLKDIDEQPTVSQWIPITERLPEVGEDGESKEYVLLSFSNCTVPEMGRYHRFEDGSGAFYLGDEEDPCSKIGLFVNAWMPVKCYEEE